MMAVTIIECIHAGPAESVSMQGSCTQLTCFVVSHSLCLPAASSSPLLLLSPTPPLASSLDHLTVLIELNLSDNSIGDFTQIRHLSRLKNLEVLYLNDPHYGDNPVCNLCNYHTYALYHLQHLIVLDTIRLTEEATALAEATFLKKQMYYNMRIKVCKGNTSNLLKKASEM
jgi:hypothetical protein